MTETTNASAGLRLPRVEPGETVWVFDLDNTLYPASCNLFHQVDMRMTAFIAEFLKLGTDEARALQKHYYRTYGTTLRGLMREHRMEAARFLEYVHEIDVTPVPPSPELRAALTSLAGRKLIFTNGSVRHAENVVNRLGIGDQFEAIFDIVAADYVPKPDPAPYDRFLRKHGITPSAACMLEDLPRNLVPAHALGMATVLVKGTHFLTDVDASGEHIHHVTDDLVDWLQQAGAHQAASATPAPEQR